jgi:exosortase
MAAAPATIPVGRQIRFDRPAQVKAGVLAAAFVATFWILLDFIPPDFGQIVYAWIHQVDWSHGPLIPLFSAYLVYVNWDRIRRCEVRYTWVGLPILLAGLGLYAWSLTFLSIGYAKPLAMMICLLGVVIFLCGVPMLRYTWLPWLYLFFAIPLPQRYYFYMTNPLRRLAAEVANMVLGLVPGLDGERVGSNLEFWYRGTKHQIGVADACSGMRSTVTLCAVGVAVAFMSERPWWQRLILVAACVPIATFCNFIRVTVTCWLTVFVDPKYAHGTYHTMLGLLVILLAFGIFSGLAWVLEHLFVEDDEEPDPQVTTG